MLFSSFKNTSNKFTGRSASRVQRSVGFLKASKAPRTKSWPLFFVRAAIWAAVPLMLFAALHFSGFGTVKQDELSYRYVPSTQQAYISTASSPVSYYANVGDSYTTTQPGFVPNQSAINLLVVKYQQQDQDSINLLPAWRWRSATMLDTYGLTDAPQQTVAGIGDVFFGVSSLLWWITLNLMRFVFSFDVLMQAGRAMNAGFVAISSSLYSSGIVMLVLVVGMFVVAKNLVKGASSSGISLIFTFLLPVAALSALTNLASQGPNTPQGTSKNPGSVNTCDNTAASCGLATGSPVWIAMQASTFTSSVASYLGTGFGAIPSVTGNASAASYGAIQPSCAAYASALTTAYSQANAPAAAPPGQGPSISTTDTVVLVSKLWENATVPLWSTAQYGESPTGLRAYCHQMEGSANIPRDEQATVGQAALYPGLPADQLLQAGGTPSTANPRKDPYIYNASGDSKDKLAYLFAWDACVAGGQNADQLYAQEAWYVVENGATGPACTRWWNGDDVTREDKTKLLRIREDKVGDLKTSSVSAPGVMDSADSDVECKASDANCRILAYGTPPPNQNISAANGNKVSVDLADVATAVNSSHGKNPGQRLQMGIIAAVIAGVYMWALGGVAIGVLFAQLGLIILMVLLPGTLLLMAVPYGAKGQRHPAGARLLKMTFGFVASKTILTVMLVLVINLVYLFESIAPPGADGLWQALAPLAAVLLLRKLMKSAGFGDIFSAKGSLGLASSSAMAAGAKGKNKSHALARHQSKFARGFDNMKKPASKALSSKAPGLFKDPKKSGKNAGGLKNTLLNAASKHKKPMAMAAGGMVALPWLAAGGLLPLAAAATAGAGALKTSAWARKTLDGRKAAKQQQERARSLGVGAKGPASSLQGMQASTSRDMARNLRSADSPEALKAEESLAKQQAAQFLALAGVGAVTAEDARERRGNLLASQASITAKSGPEKGTAFFEDNAAALLADRAMDYQTLRHNGNVVYTDGKGSINFDGEGEIVTRFAKVDSDGMNPITVPMEAAVDLKTNTLREGFTVQTEMVQLSEPQARVHVQAVAQSLGVGASALAGSLDGLPPQVIPASTGSIPFSDSTPMPVVAASLATNAALLVSPDVTKQIREDMSLTENQKNRALNLFNELAGNLLTTINIDVDRPADLQRLEVAIEARNSGQPSDLDDINYDANELDHLMRLSIAEAISNATHSDVHRRDVIHDVVSSAETRRAELPQYQAPVAQFQEVVATYQLAASSSDPQAQADAHQAFQTMVASLDTVLQKTQELQGYTASLDGLQRMQENIANTPSMDLASLAAALDKTATGLEALSSASLQGETRMAQELHDLAEAAESDSSNETEFMAKLEELLSNSLKNAMAAAVALPPPPPQVSSGSKPIARSARPPAGIAQG